jgi:hypothetical protein
MNTPVRVTPELACHIVELSGITGRLEALEKHYHHLKPGQTALPVTDSGPVTAPVDAGPAAHYPEMAADIGTVISEWGTSYWWAHNPAGVRLARWFQDHKDKPVDAGPATGPVTTPVNVANTMQTPEQDDSPAVEALMAITIIPPGFAEAVTALRQPNPHLAARATLSAIRRGEVPNIFCRLPDYAEGAEITALRAEVERLTRDLESANIVSEQIVTERDEARAELEELKRLITAACISKARSGVDVDARSP